MDASTVYLTKLQPEKAGRRKIPSSAGRKKFDNPVAYSTPNTAIVDSVDYGYALHNVSEGEEDARSDLFPVNEMENLRIDKSGSSSPRRVIEDFHFPHTDSFIRGPSAITSGKHHPTTVQMMTDAIKKIDDKKGASIIAIKKWILGTYPDVNEGRLKHHMKLAIIKGLEDGNFKRPKSTPLSNQTSMTGRLMITKQTTEKLLPKPKRTTKKLARNPKKVLRELPQLSEEEEEEEGGDEIPDVPQPKPAKAAAKAKKSQKSQKPEGDEKEEGDKSKKKQVRSKKLPEDADKNNNKDNDVETKKKPQKKPAKKQPVVLVSNVLADMKKSKKATSTVLTDSS